MSPVKSLVAMRDSIPPNIPRCTFRIRPLSSRLPPPGGLRIGLAAEPSLSGFDAVIFVDVAIWTGRFLHLSGNRLWNELIAARGDKRHC